MENSTYTAIDYNSYENRVIENRIREYYPRVKALIEIIITKRSRDTNICLVQHYGFQYLKNIMLNVLKY